MLYWVSHQQVFQGINFLKIILLLRNGVLEEQEMDNFYVLTTLNLIIIARICMRSTEMEIVYRFLIRMGTFFSSLERRAKEMVNFWYHTDLMWTRGVMCG